MNLKYKEWDGVDLIDLAQNRDKWRAVVTTVMNVGVLYNARNFLTGSEIVGFS
jgi:hypothetical protein